MVSTLKSTMSGLEITSSDVSDILWDSQKRTISAGGRIIALTRSEYRLLFPLRHGRPVTYAQLAAVFGYEVDDRVRIMMDKHIDRIRSKMSGTGIYVYCVLGYGYILLRGEGERRGFHKQVS